MDNEPHRGPGEVLPRRPAGLKDSIDNPSLGHRGYSPGGDESLGWEIGLEFILLLSFSFKVPITLMVLREQN